MASVDDVFLSLDEGPPCHSSQPLYLQPKQIPVRAGLFYSNEIHFGIVQLHYVEQGGALMALFTNQCRPATRALSIFEDLK